VLLMERYSLKPGTIEDKGSYFESEILTKDHSLADKIAADKTAGWMRSVTNTRHAPGFEG
jgi:hypothetical protein